MRSWASWPSPKIYGLETDAKSYGKTAHINVKQLDSYNAF